MAVAWGGSRAEMGDGMSRGEGKNPVQVRRAHKDRSQSSVSGGVGEKRLNSKEGKTSTRRQKRSGRFWDPDVERTSLVGGEKGSYRGKKIWQRDSKRNLHCIRGF